MIKLPTGDFEFGIGVLRIGDLGFRIEDGKTINMGKTPIPHSNSTISYLITNL